MYCVVKDCTSVWNPSSNVIFHSFPSDPKKKCRWLSNLPLKGNFYKTAKICSLHFKAEHYNPERPKRLLVDALPFYSGKSYPCSDGVRACTVEPYKCSAAPNVKTLTESGVSSTSSVLQGGSSENIVNIEDESGNDERPSTSALPTRTKQAASKRKIDALQEKLIENKIILKRVRSSNVTLQKKVQMLTHVNKQLRERNIKLKRLLLEEKRKNRKDQRNVMSCDSNIKEEPDNDQNSGIETLVVKIEPPEDEMSS